MKLYIIYINSYLNEIFALVYYFNSCDKMHTAERDKNEMQLWCIYMCEGDKIIIKIPFWKHVMFGSFKASDAYMKPLLLFTLNTDEWLFYNIGQQCTILHHDKTVVFLYFSYYSFINYGQKYTILLFSVCMHALAGFHWLHPNNISRIIVLIIFIKYFQCNRYYARILYAIKF